MLLLTLINIVEKKVMPCICENCGCSTLCGERLCSSCFLDTLDDPVEKNLYAGGRFYGESLLKEDLSAQADANGRDSRRTDLLRSDSGL